MNVAAYARISTDKDDQINSLENQCKYFEDYINNHKGWKLKNIYYDEGLSGTQTVKRQGFLDMIQGALSGEIDLILTKEVCRFARNTVDVLMYTRKLKENGIGVFFILDNINTLDADGELRLTIMASIAQEESRKISERVKWGQTRSMEKGVVFGRDLLGYSVINGEMYINEYEAEIVRDIFDMYVNEGKSTSAIAKELERKRLPAKRGYEWSNSMILKVLSNEKYVGDLCQKKTITPDYITHKKVKNDGSEAFVLIKNHHEGIIDRILWERAQCELKSRSEKRNKGIKYSNKFWCSGKVVCGKCGSSYVCKSRRKGLNEYRTWGCYKKIRNSKSYTTYKENNNGNSVEKSYCENESISDRALFLCVLEFFRIIGFDLLVEGALQKCIKNRNISRDNKKDDVNKKIEKIEEKKKRALDYLIQDVISKEDYLEQVKRYDVEMQKYVDLKNTYIDERKYKYKREFNDICEITTLKKLCEILKMDKSFLGSIIERIIVNDKVVDIWAKNLDFGIRLIITVKGRMDNYHVEFENISIIF